jgi:hypothetical protein
MATLLLEMAQMTFASKSFFCARNMADDSKFFLLSCIALIFSYEARKYLKMVPLFSAN